MYKSKVMKVVNNYYSCNYIYYGKIPVKSYYKVLFY